MTDNIVEYDIWKIVGYDKRARYYESNKMFLKYLAIFKSCDPNIKAFRFTSNGWKQVK